ncbi:MAG: response regulator [Gammaproteobacteria bacterium]|nr:response regulator [Gammaproteobacteria bacterium]
MSVTDQVAPHLPLLRRYARALTGTQSRGDACVRAALEALLAHPGALAGGEPPRVALYRLFHAIWSGVVRLGEGAPVTSSGIERNVQARLQHMTPLSRQALLLTALEGFSCREAAVILGRQGSEVEALVAAARDEVLRRPSARILIIEDEPVIALDLESIVRGLGHEVTSVARTHREAIAAAEAHPPGLVLADIQLADRSSGIDAAHDIAAAFPVPVIFVTAFPERLLTGERPEPAFLITKPFDPDIVRTAIGQALFFGE